MVDADERDYLRGWIAVAPPAVLNGELEWARDLPVLSMRGSRDGMGKRVSEKLEKRGARVKEVEGQLLPGQPGEIRGGGFGFRSMGLRRVLKPFSPTRSFVGASRSFIGCAFLGNVLKISVPVKTD